MTRAQRSVIIGSAALTIFFVASLSASPAFARRGHWRLHGRIYAPAVHVQVHSHPAYPAPAACCYPPPAPTPAVIVHGPAPAFDPPALGLAIGGAAHAPASGQLPVGGVVAALQFRTSSHSLLAVELQSLGARTLSNDTRRSELAGLLAGRVFLWNAALAPYLELAAGLGHTSIESTGLEVNASQLLGRYGLGLELRLGRHLVLEGQIARVHKLRLERDDHGVAYAAFGPQDDRDVGEHERAVELRAGLAFRF